MSNLIVFIIAFFLGLASALFIVRLADSAVAGTINTGRGEKKKLLRFFRVPSEKQKEGSSYSVFKKNESAKFTSASKVYDKKHALDELKENDEI